MFLNGNESDELDSLKHGKAGLLDKLNIVLDLLLVGLSCFFEGINLPSSLKLDQGLSNLSSPGHLCGGDQNLTLG